VKIFKFSSSAGCVNDSSFGFYLLFFALSFSIVFLIGKFEPRRKKTWRSFCEEDGSSGGERKLASVEVLMKMFGVLNVWDF
jgi:hypothetical protein